MRLELGGFDYITKPFNPVDLAPLIRHHLLARVEAGTPNEYRSEKLNELPAALHP